MPFPVSPPLLASSSSGNHGVYVALVVLHVISALVAFGGIAISGVYAATAGHLERPGALEEARRWFGGRNWGVLLLPTVPLLGVLALVADARPGRIAEAWAVAALAVWCLVAAIAWGVIRPTEATLRRLLNAPARSEVGTERRLLADADKGQPDQRLQEAARRLGRAAAVCDVAFVVVLGLMIWQPG
jgi:hypothetical protein